jgi:hypothetical protein
MVVSKRKKGVVNAVGGLFEAILCGGKACVHNEVGNRTAFGSSAFVYIVKLTDVDAFRNRIACWDRYADFQSVR